MNLWTFLAVVANVTFFTSIVLFGLHLEFELSERTTKQVRYEAQDLANEVSRLVMGDLVANRFDLVQKSLIDVAQEHGHLRQLQVADPLGHIVASVRVEAAGRAVPVPGDINRPLDSSRVEYDLEHEHVRVQPVGTSASIGLVRVVNSLREVEASRREIRADYLAAGLLTVFITSLLITLFLRRSVRALENATRFAKVLTDNRGATLKNVCGIREVQELTRALNDASLELHHRYMALKDGEARKAAVMEASLDGLVAIDDRGRIVDANPAAEKAFGLDRATLLGRQMRNLLAPARPHACEDACLHVFLSTGNCPGDGCKVLNQRIETEAVRKNGDVFPIELTLAPFFLGGRRHCLASFRDITQRRWLELEQRNITATLRTTVNELAAQQYALDEHAIVSITDLQGNIVYANEKFERISQYNLNELLGKNHRLIKSGVHSQAFYAELWHTISEGKSWRGTLVNRRKDGSHYWVDCTIVPVLDDNQQPRQYLSIRTDITELEMARIALDEARAREVRIGNEIQRSLLFGEVPGKMGPLAVSVHTEPSEGVDGDFYEFFSYRPHRFDLSIGDVMGKGISAALIGAAVKQQLNQVIAEQLAAAGEAGHAPAADVLMNALHGKLTQRLIDLDCFVTLSYLGFDLATRQVEFVGAGHPPAILTGRAGTRLVSGDNLPLGVLAEEHYTRQTLDFVPGDLLCLYSDGLTEAKNGAGEEFGLERLVARVESLHAGGVPASTLSQAVRAEINDFARAGRLNDDRSLIVLAFEEEPTEGVAGIDLVLPWSLDGLGALQETLLRFGLDAGLSAEDANALVLAGFETGTNIARHAPPLLADASVHCALRSSPDGVNVAFHYLGAPFDLPEGKPDFSGASNGGFGLYIIRNSVDEVRYTQPVPGVCRIDLHKRASLALPP